MESLPPKNSQNRARCQSQDGDLHLTECHLGRLSVSDLVLVLKWPAPQGAPPPALGFRKMLNN